MTLGIFLLTGLTSRTDLPVMWAWMFITGFGIGPTLSVFTIVIQSVVPYDRLGVATGNLTFFRQIGGSVGLAIVGTLFAQSFASRLVPSMETAGVPPEVAGTVANFANSGAGGDITQVGGVGLADQLSQVPALQGFVDAIVSGIHEAFSLAIADTFWFALATTVIALVVVVVGLREVPLRGFSQTPAADGRAKWPRRGSGRRGGWPPRRGAGAREGLDQRGRREPAP